ncbi:hypothetical protein OG792_20790 [Micromonospora sp. NBC_01699]|uniref:hypothetical protein n=1 Tax=Micromonospora sp. NBC_01699 TaxID=2975984 RepID=UPI002E27AA48|nr:hypothetical protein [Micromonospora sp. NBC_01699]
MRDVLIIGVSAASRAATAARQCSSVPAARDAGWLATSALTSRSGPGSRTARTPPIRHGRERHELTRLEQLIARHQIGQRR